MRTPMLSEGREYLANIRNASRQRLRAAAEISSGLKVRKPSDASAAAANIVLTRRSLTTLDQFRVNLQTVQSENRAVDRALTEAGNVIQRAVQLASQAATSTTTEEQRDHIRVEIEALHRHAVSIANTQFGGEYVFAGTATNDPPFVLDSTVPEGVRYVGNEADRTIRFPDGRPAQYALPGNTIFSLPDRFEGSGRTADTSGAVLPDPPLGVGVAFEGSVSGTISVDLDTFAIASGAPSSPAGGEEISLVFTSTDGQIVRPIQTLPLLGGETTAQIADALNVAINDDSVLAGGFVFSDEGGLLKLTQTEQLGVGFDFTVSATGGLTTGLEPGGRTGGQSAQEIATALNAQIAGDPALTAAAIQFSAENGELTADGRVDFSFTAVDFARGTSFASGIAGRHVVGGEHSANALRSLNQLATDLANNDVDAILARVGDLQRSVDHVSGSQAFYGGLLRQIDVTLEGLERVEVVNQTRLSELQDADLLEAISQLTQSSSAEEFALQVASRQQPTLFELLA